MSRDELRRALNEAAEGPERDFAGAWERGRRVRRRRRAAQGLGGVALVAAAVGAFALGGGNLLGEDATIDQIPATQAPEPEEATEATEARTNDEQSAEATTSQEATEAPETGLPEAGDPLPTTVEEYARVFIAAGMAGDEDLLARMGTDGAVEASVTWTDQSWLLEEATVSDSGTDGVQVQFFAEGPYQMVLNLDREAVEAGADDGVLHGEATDAVELMTAEEYADLTIEMWGIGYAGLYATDDVERVLDGVPTDGTWERTGAAAEGDVLLVTYENEAVDGVLVLTVDPHLVEIREYDAVVNAQYDGT